MNESAPILISTLFSRHVVWHHLWMNFFGFHSLFQTKGCAFTANSEARITINVRLCHVLRKTFDINYIDQYRLFSFFLWLRLVTFPHTFSAKEGHRNRLKNLVRFEHVFYTFWVVINAFWWHCIHYLVTAPYIPSHHLILRRIRKVLVSFDSWPLGRWITKHVTLMVVRRNIKNIPKNKNASVRDFAE